MRHLIYTVLGAAVALARASEPASTGPATLSKRNSLLLSSGSYAPNMPAGYLMVTFAKGSAKTLNTAVDGKQYPNCGLLVHSNPGAGRGVFFAANPKTRHWERHDVELPTQTGREAGAINPNAWKRSSENATDARADDIAFKHTFNPPVAGASFSWCRRVSRGLRRTWRLNGVLLLTRNQKYGAGIGAAFGAIGLGAAGLGSLGSMGSGASRPRPRPATSMPAPAVPARLRPEVEMAQAVRSGADRTAQSLSREEMERNRKMTTQERLDAQGTSAGGKSSPGAKINEVD